MNRELTILAAAAVATASCASRRATLVADDWPRALAEARATDGVLLVELWARW